MAIAGRTGAFGLYGSKTRRLQKSITRESFGLTFKEAEFYMYLGEKGDVTEDIWRMQDNVFFETRNRAYETVPRVIPISMEEKSEQTADYSQFGYIDPIGNKTVFRLYTDDMTEFLGRRIVVGDVFEMPFFSTPTKRDFWIVSDVDNSQDAEKFITVLTAEPLEDSVETSDIPVDGDDLDSIFAEQEQQFTEQIPADVDTKDLENIPEQEVDYRNRNQADFLDDLNGDF